MALTPLETADMVGIISFALSGFLIAVHMKLDVLGIFITSFLTAFGGGMIRDVIANKVPYIFTHTLPIILVVITLVLAISFKLHKITNIEGKTAFVITDALGLVSFSITGALIAIEVGFNFIGILLLSLLTAIGGGTIRDILINRVPAVLVSDFYGTVAIITGFIIYVLDYFGQITSLNLTLTFAFGLILRLLAYYKQWQLPKLS